MIYMHLEHDVHVYAPVYVRALLRHANTEARGRKTGEANSLSALSPCSHMLDLCAKPIHSKPFLSTLLVSKNLTKSPGMWEKAGGLLKLLGVGLLF